MRLIKNIRGKKVMVHDRDSLDERCNTDDIAKPAPTFMEDLDEYQGRGFVVRYCKWCMKGAAPPQGG